MKEFIFHNIIKREENRYTAICLELDIATEGQSLEETRSHLKEAVESYIESYCQMLWIHPAYPFFSIP